MDYENSDDPLKRQYMEKLQEIMKEQINEYGQIEPILIQREYDNYIPAAPLPYKTPTLGSPQPYTQKPRRTEKLSALTEDFNKFKAHLQPEENKEHLAMRLLNITAQTIGYSTVGFHNDKIVLEDVDTKERFLFLSRLLLPKLDYDMVRYYLYVFLNDRAAFGGEDKEPDEHPF